ncbi:Cof-type HAD-IIB family hydrolase [uncultured Brachyspira sp.]|uniref:Cof-type HAD-IIB family hydrolase n=1 Tax=uncultured Brachyspira sp. TaxID=221953 RepID=UPI0026252178|nr:Cof-type HAD-IIB family hydrolase [uncultured Brachyspira sp.]
MVKAVFFDIDGTLVSFNTHKVSDLSKEAIKLLKDKGIKVFIATGRIKKHINNLGDLKFDGYITANGFDCYIGEKSIYRNSIAREEIYSLMHYLKNKENFPCSVMIDSGIFINYITEDVEKVSNSINLTIPSADNYYELLEKNADNILQLNLFVDDKKEKELMHSIFKNCEASRWHPLFADVNNKGGGKHIGIDKIIEYYDIELSDTMAFGDGGNDISMIKHAAVGIAMGNADEEVKKYADYITDDVDNDGIYKALKYFNML